jgi:hypothetical protein
MAETDPDPRALEKAIREVLGHLGPLLSEETDA